MTFDLNEDLLAGVAASRDKAGGESITDTINRLLSTALDSGGRGNGSDEFKEWFEERLRRFECDLESKIDACAKDSLATGREKDDNVGKARLIPRNAMEADV